MKKIVIATDAWHPQGNGVVRCVEEAVKHLKADGFEVVLIQPGFFKCWAIPFYPEIKLSLFPKRKVEQIIKKEKPDYVHIVTEGPIGFATRSVCLKNKIKFTTANHTNFQVYIQHYFAKFQFLTDIMYKGLRWFHNASNGTMVITKELKQDLESRGFKRVLLWPLGVDTDLFKRNENVSAEAKGWKKPVFIYFGRIAKEKNVEEFLKLELPGTKVVVGGGPLRPVLEEKYGKKAVFTGFQSGQQLVDLISASDVFVLPSYSDTFPLAIVEAFACGVPVACHNVMNLDRLVTEDVGVLGEDLAKAALECLKIPRENCRQYALKFSWSESVKQFEKNLVENKWEK